MDLEKKSASVLIKNVDGIFAWVMINWFWSVIWEQEMYCCSVKFKGYILK